MHNYSEGSINEVNQRGVHNYSGSHKIHKSDGEEELKETFKVFDVNGDGKVSTEELLEVFLAIEDACTIEDCWKIIGVFFVFYWTGREGIRQFN